MVRGKCLDGMYVREIASGMIRVMVEEQGRILNLGVYLSTSNTGPSKKTKVKVFKGCKRLQTPISVTALSLHVRQRTYYQRYR